MKLFEITFFFGILTPLLLFSSNYPIFSKKELSTIERKNGKISKNRIVDYQKKLALMQTFTPQKQLNYANNYLNQLLPQYDDVIQHKEDHWATPKEFLITGFGDCEDYVIIKYFTLIKLGFDEKKLYITVVKERYHGGHHMVLTYFKNEGESPLVLDNLSFRILDLKTRSDLKADTFINAEGVYKLKKNTLVKIYQYSLQYKQLCKNIEKESKKI